MYAFLHNFNDRADFDRVPYPPVVMDCARNEASLAPAASDDADAMSTSAGSVFGGSTSGNKSRTNRKKAATSRAQGSHTQKTEVYITHL